MKERIRELVKQAGGHFSTHNLMSNPMQHRESIELWDDRIEKFAELIIKECAIIANRADNTETEIRCMYDVITEHFGVEE